VGASVKQQRIGSGNAPYKVVRPNDGGDLKQTIEAYFGEKPIWIPKGLFTVDPIVLSGIDDGIIHGDMRNALVKLKDNANSSVFTLTDCNDFDLDQFAIDGNKAAQASGHGINMLRCRRSSLGARFLRIDNCKEDGIHNNGSGAYPNSNVAIVFGNLFIYTCDGFGFYEGGFAGDDVIMRAYIQECTLGGIDELGTHLQVICAHLHENAYGIRNATHHCEHGIINIEGSDYDGVRIDGGGGSQGMKNGFNQLWCFDNNQSMGANYSDVRCVGATAKWNYINSLISEGYTHVKYTFSDHAVTASGNKNRVHLIRSQDWATAQMLLCTDGGSESIVDLVQTTT
jgi:hypothetical protein